jgi:hypothetical protein
LAGKPEGKRPFGRSKCKWEDNVKKDLNKKFWEELIAYFP